MYGDEHEDDEGYRDPFTDPPVRCCDRCGAGDDKSKPNPMCGEVQLAFGLVSWICHDCRKDWHRMFKGHELQKAYAHASFELEFWKARVGTKTPEDQLAKGLELWDKVDDLEMKINEVANQWLIGGTDEVRTL